MRSLSKLSFAIELTQSSRVLLDEQDEPDFDGEKVFVALLIDVAEKNDRKKKSHQLYSYTAHWLAVNV